MRKAHYRAMFYKAHKIWHNLLSNFNRLEFVKINLLTGFGIALGILIFVFFYRIFNYLKTVDIFGEMLTIRLITMVFLSFISMLIFSNVLTSISVFFLSKDVEFLFSTPVGTGTIYFFKFMEMLYNSSYMILMFGVPVFIAYGFVYDANLPFYGLMILVFIPFLLIPAAFGSSVTQLLMRFLPARRTHQAMMALGVFFLVMIIMFIRFLEPEKLISPIGTQLFTEYLKKMRIPAPSWLPSTMAAEAIVSACKGEYGRFAFFLVPLVMIAAISYFVSMLLALALYRRGWDDSRILKPRTEPRKKARIPLPKMFFTGFLEPKSVALVAKEIKFFFRDTSQWSQLFLLGALVLIYIFNIINIPVDTKFLRNILAFFNICLAGFVLSGVAVRFAFPSISMEGKAFWVIQSSPVLIRKFVLIKFFIYLIPQLVLAEIIVMISNYILGVSDFMFYFYAISVFVMTIGLTGLGVGLGCIYPDFKADSPDRVAVSAGGVIFMISALGYLLIMIILLAGPIYSYFADKLKLGDINNFLVFLCYALAFFLSVFVCYLPLRFGMRRLQTTEC